LISEREVLQAKFAGLFRWEKRKRRELIVLSVGCYSLLAALAMLPFSGLFRAWINPWWVPIFIALVAAPILLLIERWRSGGPLRLLLRLDKALSLEERAVTAWEILCRQQTLPTELRVVKEAGEKLESFDPKIIFPREATWQTYVIAPLFALWLGLLWFDISFQGERGRQPPFPSPIAQKLGEFARQLQEMAKAQGLPDSLNLGRDLEKTAQRRLEGATADDRFKAEVAAASKKIEGMTRDEKAPFNAAATQEGLRDLRTELEAARDGLGVPDGVPGEREIGSELHERLAGLPHLKEAIEKNLPAGAGRSGKELKSFLDQLEKDVSRQLDRRALLDTQQFLEKMLKEGPAQTGANTARVEGQEERDFPGEAQKEETQSRFPGTEPGKKESGSEPLRQFPAGAATHLKGLLGEGSSAGVMLKGKPAPGKAALTEQDVVASYQRRAEAELSTERVPEELKETIKNYFLSLGMGEGQ
jgi:hypothetical protein